MLITDYNSLIAAVISKSHRSDLSDKVRGFIRSAEAKIYRSVPFLAVYKVIPITVNAGEYSAVLPDDYFTKGVLSEVNGADISELVYTSADKLVSPGKANRPQLYSIAGGKIVFNCFLDKNRDYQFKYQGADYLSDSNTTNWLLRSNPDIYLAAALFELSTFTQDEIAAVYEAERDRGLSELKGLDNITQTMTQPPFINLYG